MSRPTPPPRHRKVTVRLNAGEFFDLHTGAVAGNRSLSEEMRRRLLPETTNAPSALTDDALMTSQGRNGAPRSWTEG